MSLVKEDSPTPHLDTIGMVLSLACLVHCLVAPLLLMAFPLVDMVAFGGDRVHRALLLFILPTAVLALTSGCRQHRSRGIVILGLLGAGTLVATASLGQVVLGAFAERACTAFGGSLLALAHLGNYRECRRLHGDAGHGAGRRLAVMQPDEGQADGGVSAAACPAFADGRQLQQAGRREGMG